MWKGRHFLYVIWGLILGGKTIMAFQLTSPTFVHGGEISKAYTCEGNDLFPGVEWSGAPQGTKIFVLICDDPDVPEALRDKVPDLVWDHLVIFNIPSNVSSIPQGPFECPLGAFCGTNSWGRQDYGGPCPPNPKYHRYHFTLYALDAPLNLSPSAGKKDVLNALEGHLLGKALLIGRYMKQAFKG